MLRASNNPASNFRIPAWARQHCCRCAAVAAHRAEALAKAGTFGCGGGVLSTDGLASININHRRNSLSPCLNAAAKVALFSVLPPSAGNSGRHIHVPGSAAISSRQSKNNNVNHKADDRHQTQMNTNRTNSLLAVALAVGTLAFSLQPSALAQSTTTSNATTTVAAPATGIVTNIPNFFATAFNWMTAINANYTWTNTTFQVEDGMINQNGTGAADYLWAQYDLDRFEFIGTGSFYGTGSAFTSAEAGLGYAIVQNGDLQISGAVLAGGSKVGTSTDTMKFRVDPLVKLDKKLTINTYATIWLGIPWQQSKTFDGTPEFGVGLGATF